MTGECARCQFNIWKMPSRTTCTTAPWSEQELSFRIWFPWSWPLPVEGTFPSSQSNSKETQCLKWRKILTNLINVYSSFSFFGWARGMWKFLCQGSSLCCRSDLSHSSDNARSLTHWATRELLILFLTNFFFLVFLPFLGPFPRHMAVPRLGVELEL